MSEFHRKIKPTDPDLFSSIDVVVSDGEILVSPAGSLTLALDLATADALARTLRAACTRVVKAHIAEVEA